ncbi:MAG: serine/threonine-protein kinase, partial [Planctomycetota bacterium]
MDEEERYEIVKTLGEGGMGIVELVKDHLLGREVARKTIKVNKKNLQNLDAKQKILLLRLKREATITAILEHPNIIPLYEMQQKPSGEIQFTMRKVEGETLRNLMYKKRTGKSNDDETRFLNIFLKVCDAMGYAHSKKVIHRDLKPDNVMLGAFGEVYVMDWGIAKQLGDETSEESSLEEPDDSKTTPPKTARNNALKDTKVDLRTIGGMGTQGYMPPEQADDASQVTPASDIFALGKILRECFTLMSPQEEFKRVLARFQEEEKLEKSKRSNPSNLVKDLDQKIPSEVLAIIQKATEEEPENRYQSLSELIEDL